MAHLEVFILQARVAAHLQLEARKRAAVAAQTLQEAVQVVDITPQPQRLALQAEARLVILLLLLLLEDPLEEPELVQMEQQELLRQ